MFVNVMVTIFKSFPFASADRICAPGRSGTWMQVYFSEMRSKRFRHIGAGPPVSMPIVPRWSGNFSLRTIRIRRGVFSLSAILSVLLSISIHGMVEKCFSRLHTRKRCELVFFSFLEMPPSSRNQHCLLFKYFHSVLGELRVQDFGHFQSFSQALWSSGLFHSDHSPIQDETNFHRNRLPFFFFLKKKKRNFLRLCGGRCWFAW